MPYAGRDGKVAGPLKIGENEITKNDNQTSQLNIPTIENLIAVKLAGLDSETKELYNILFKGLSSADYERLAGLPLRILNSERTITDEGLIIEGMGANPISDTPFNDSFLIHDLGSLQKFVSGQYGVIPNYTNGLGLIRRVEEIEKNIPSENCIIDGGSATEVVL